MDGGELGNHVFSVLDAVEEGVEVADGGDEAVGGVDGVVGAFGLGGGEGSSGFDFVGAFSEDGVVVV